jgi:hypothetical protein
MGAVATVTGEGRRDLRRYRQGAGKIPKTHRAADYSNGRKGGCAITALALAAMPAAGVWALIERLVS